MRVLIVMMLSLFIVGCAAPAPSPRSGTDASVGARQPQPVARLPRTNDPLPPERVQTPPSTPVQVVRTCKVDSDCVVKDVGNCCGYFPACVHKASPTDPAGVRAQCAKSGMASVCGFNEITACRCVRNQCIGEQEPVGGWMDDPPAPPPADR